MKTFKNNFLKLIDAGASQAKGLVESFNDLIESIDIDSQLEYLNERKASLIKKSNDLFNEFSDLMKQVRDSLSDFSVTVPYDESIGEKIFYVVNDGKLRIEVSYSDENSTRCNNTTVLIPVNCDVEQMKMTKNTVLKTATITIPKKIKVKEEVAETKPSEEPTPKKKTATKKTVVKVKSKTKIKETAAEEPAPTEPTKQEEAVEETPTHVRSKLAETLRHNASKYANVLKRDSNGRFIRREVDAE